jgi:hypothetical protein
MSRLWLLEKSAMFDLIGYPPRGDFTRLRPFWGMVSLTDKAARSLMRSEKRALPDVLFESRPLLWKLQMF